MYLKKGLASLLAAGILTAGCSVPAGVENGESAVLQEEMKTASIEKLQVEYRTNPLGIEEEAPLFSWQMVSDVRGQKQNAYQIFVADSAENLRDGAYLWDSGRVESGLSVAIPYGGGALEPRSRYYWKVTAWDQNEEELVSEEEAWFETGLMEEDFSDAVWIGAPEAPGISPAEEECFYTIEYDFQGQDASAGFIFGADTDRYGEYYLWLVSAREEEVFLKTCRVEENVFRDEQEVSLKEYCGIEDYRNGRIHMKIQVEGDRAVTMMDGNVVAETSLNRPKALGRIGLYNHRTVECSWFDNILIRDRDGNTVLEERFESGEENIFSPEYIKVRDGMGCARAGVTLTPGNDGPAPMLRREFEGGKDIVSARLYASALGIYQIFINGQLVSDHYFDPGLPVYDKELEYCTYDVTELVKEGQNAVGVVLGHGWYDRAVGGVGDWNPWGECDPAFLGKLILRYEDGTEQTIATDADWKVWTDGPIRRDDMYQGEFYDAGYELEGWSEPGFSAESWSDAALNRVDGKFLDMDVIPVERESVRNVYTMEPVAVTSPGEGTYVYDFGQEFTGVCRVTLKGSPGTCITMRYGEALNTEQLKNKDDEEGTVWTQNLLTAANTDYYVLKGGETECYAPSLVCRGFRYMQISGLDESAEIEKVEGLVLMSDLEETTTFNSSDIWLNRICHNILWTQRSNFLATPTDCPQRDERFGWTGDANVFSPTAVYQMNVRSYLQNFLQGMRLEQHESGAFPDMVPRDVNQSYGNNGWGDAGIVITWELYQQYGDLSIVEENYEAMCRWADYLVETSEGYLRFRPDSYGDHLEYHSTSKEFTDTDQTAYSIHLLSRMAEALSKKEDAARYEAIYEAYRSAWQKRWIQEDGRLSEGSQTAYALGLEYGLLPEDGRQQAADYLYGAVEWSGFHPTVGFVGMPRILQALSENGHADAAYQILLQKTAPSWSHDIALGATTIAESWSSYVAHEDGQYSLHGSLNHYSLGAVGEWFYSGILGICTDEQHPGFKRILLQPQITDRLEFAEGSYRSVYGTIDSRWENTEDGYLYHVKIPANTSAELILPAALSDACTESGMAPEEAKGILSVEKTETGIRMELESGTYDFQVKRNDR